MNETPITDMLRDLLGPNVVYLPWPLHSKGSHKQWGHLTAANMTPDHLQKCETGNIGVALGDVSGGLIVVDCDLDNLVPAYLASNPGWNGTLRTRGSRGCAFWLRMNGVYPRRTAKLKTHAGDDAGEFRSNGSQSIIHGMHPNGYAYTILKKAKPLVVEFASIKWPTEIDNPPRIEPKLIQRDRETESHSHRVTDVTDATDATDVVCVNGRSLTIEEAIQLSVPCDVHQSNSRLFTLARAVKTLEINSGKFPVVQLCAVFNRWYTLSGKHLRPNQSRDEYLNEFMSAYKSAKVPLGDGIVRDAWKLAQSKPLPPEAVAAYTDKKSQLVVALCRELQIKAGENPFYLSARTLADLLKQDGHAAAARCLRSLCVMELLAEIEKGSGNRASRYRYKGAMT